MNQSLLSIKHVNPGENRGNFIYSILKKLETHKEKQRDSQWNKHREADRAALCFCPLSALSDLSECAHLLI